MFVSCDRSVYYKDDLFCLKDKCDQELAGYTEPHMNLVCIQSYPKVVRLHFCLLILTLLLCRPVIITIFA